MTRFAYCCVVLSCVACSEAVPPTADSGATSDTGEPAVGDGGAADGGATGDGGEDTDEPEDTGVIGDCDGLTLSPGAATETSLNATWREGDATLSLGALDGEFDARADSNTGCLRVAPAVLTVWLNRLDCVPGRVEIDIDEQGVAGQTTLAVSDAENTLATTSSTDAGSQTLRADGEWVESVRIEARSAQLCEMRLY